MAAPAKTRRAPATPEPVRLDAVIAPLVEGEAAQSMGRDLERLNQGFLQTAVVTITDPASYTAAADFLKALAAKRKQVEQFFAPMKTLAHRLHKAICTRENTLLAPLDSADRAVRHALVAYDREQERRRREEEARLQEQARKDEEARMLAEAALLESQGHAELAAATVEAALAAPAPVVTIAPTTPTVAGVSMGEKWTWRAVNDDPARAVELLAKTGNHQYLCLDERKLAAFARMHKAAARLPGVQFFDEGKVIVRS
jgi:hypothetical protein